VNHLPRKVLVSMTFRELEKEKSVNGGLYVPSFGFRFRTSRLVRNVLLRDDTIEMRNGAGTKVSCAMSARIDYESDFVVLRVPRSCLGTPRWVRVGGGSGITDSSVYSLHDDARSSDGSAGPHYGPRVYR